MLEVPQMLPAVLLNYSSPPLMVPFNKTDSDVFTGGWSIRLPFIPFVLSSRLPHKIRHHVVGFVAVDVIDF
jgi:hypothetical protein